MNHEDPQYVAISILLYLPPTEEQIFCSAFYFRRLSAKVLPLR